MTHNAVADGPIPDIFADLEAKRTQLDVHCVRNFAFELCRMFDAFKISCSNSAGSNIWHNTLQDPI